MFVCLGILTLWEEGALRFIEHKWQTRPYYSSRQFNTTFYVNYSSAFSIKHTGSVGKTITILLFSVETSSNTLPRPIELGDEMSLHSVKKKADILNLKMLNH